MAKILVIDEGAAAVAALEAAPEAAGLSFERSTHDAELVSALQSGEPGLVLLNLDCRFISAARLRAALDGSGLSSTPVVLYGAMPARELSRVAHEIRAIGWVQQTPGPLRPIPFRGNAAALQSHPRLSH